MIGGSKSLGGGGGFGSASYSSTASKGVSRWQNGSNATSKGISLRQWKVKERRCSTCVMLRAAAMAAAMVAAASSAG